MKKFVVEFIGTLFLILTIGCVVMGSKDDPSMKWIAPLVIGSVLMVMIYAGGHISGGHFNPAVTLAVFLRKKCTAAEVPGYMLAQCAAAVVAATLVPYLKGNPEVTALQVDPMRALIAEFLFTFALCYVVLNVATAKGTQGNSFYGLAIGFTVFAGAASVGMISGAAFNPAVAIGTTMMGFLNASNIWIYLVAGFAASVAAAAVFKFVNPSDA
jgi:aquaporin Z